MNFMLVAAYIIIRRNIYQFLNEEMKREAIEQCIRRDCIFWLMTTAKMLNDKLCS
ncbi:hypothetical protein NC653_004654 [Populus alba x Populus x berolinensis]|uniref:Uncharacterized protein n=1 Tax=Populus alba x Populus x berolinensis TaxID=444605 RepID=A0AAD6RVC6_9ROSI|nr:hypothetical protein NC653_004654 [Populus alba x Populus x berolinensis]